MKILPTAIPDVVVMEPVVFGDHRGFFMEVFRDEVFQEAMGNYSFVQENHSKSSQGILRGLHYQIKRPQGKLVRVVAGEIFDVAVDIRKRSATYGQWVGELLSAENKKSLWIPPGFAHGFYVTSPTAEVIYKCTDYYAPEYERGLLWNDPELAINWPLTSSEDQVILSDKDKAALPLAQIETFP